MEIDYKDHGKKPYIINIEDATTGNDNYRTTIWTGSKLQVTVMSIQPGDDIGL
ncbi:cupin domain-containing protein, partial [Enterococcus dongliensis]|nr:cupin domain-containing protein [Enterococcus dongliensis]